jgi:hypothetical protein
VTPAEFNRWFPNGDFSALSDAYIQRFIDMASAYFNVDRWGAHYSEGLANFVAHKISISQDRQPKNLQVDGGNTTEKHVAAVGVSFDSAILQHQIKDPYLLTSYGREYARLRSIVGMGGLAV